MTRLPTQSEFLRNGLVPCSETHPCPAETLCTICTEDCVNEKKKVVQVVPCSHWFHGECILHWFTSSSQKRGTCPNDRIDVFEPDPLDIDRLAMASRPLRHPAGHPVILPAVCIGAPSADSLRRAGLRDGMHRRQLTSKLRVMVDRAYNVVNTLQYLLTIENRLLFLERWQLTRGSRDALWADMECCRREAGRLQMNPEAECVRMRLSEAARHIDNFLTDGLLRYHSTLRTEVNDELEAIQGRMNNLRLTSLDSYTSEVVARMELEVQSTRSKNTADVSVDGIAALECTWCTAQILLQGLRQLEADLPPNTS